MGPAEERWLSDGLANGQRRWNLIAKQVMMAPLDRREHDGETVERWNMDSWGGYPAARKRLLDHVAGHKISNIVVTTGDEHQNYALELRTDGKEGRALATEFVATSISSGGDGEEVHSGYAYIRDHNPHRPFIKSRRGYMLHEVGRDRWRADFKTVDQVSRPGGLLSLRQTYWVERAQPGLHLA